MAGDQIQAKELWVKWPACVSLKPKTGYDHVIKYSEYQVLIELIQHLAYMLELHQQIPSYGETLLDAKDLLERLDKSHD